LNNATTKKTPTHIINIIKAAFGAFESVVLIVVDVSVVVCISRVFTAFILSSRVHAQTSSTLFTEEEQRNA
jgi:hypothetical protein